MAHLPPDLQAWVDLYETEERRQERMMGRYSSEGSGSGDFKQPPPGSHVARAIKIIDIGTHHDEYQGEPTIRNQFILQWELPNETIEIDGVQKPLIVSKFYTNVLSEKANLRKDLEAWRSRPFTEEEKKRFDLNNVLGKACLLTITHTDKGKAKVVAVSPLPKGMECPPQVNPTFAFWIDEWDDNKFASLSEGFKNLIVQSDEYKAFSKPAAEQAKQEKLMDDIPF